MEAVAEELLDEKMRRGWRLYSEQRISAEFLVV